MAYSLWLDGQWIEKEAFGELGSLPVMTHGLHYGTAVFEGLRFYEGRVFQSDRHYQRFGQSARFLDFDIPYSVQALQTVTQELVSGLPYKDGYIRAIAWCGEASMLVSHRLSNIRVAVHAAARPLPYTQDQYQNGLHLTGSCWKRPDPQTAPVHSKAAGLYMTSSMSKKKAEEEGCDDALMLDYKDRIAEATSSNIFFVRDGALLTPFPHSFLKGITRQTCMDLAKDAGIAVQEGDFYIQDLSSMQEVFLTGTAIEIVPVASITLGGQKWSFSAGPMVHWMQKEFRKLTQKGL